MADKKNIVNDQGSGNSIQALMDAVQITTSCSKYIQEAAAAIMTSCYTQGTRGEEHKTLLLDKVDCLISLAELYECLHPKGLKVPP